MHAIYRIHQGSGFGQGWDGFGRLANDEVPRGAVVAGVAPEQCGKPETADPALIPVVLDYPDDVEPAPGAVTMW